MKGIGVSAGMAFAKAYIVEDDTQIKKYEVSDIKREFLRLTDAVERAKEQLEGIMKAAVEDCGKENAEIFDFQFLLLGNESFIKEIRDYVEEFKINCEYALDVITDLWIKRFSELDNMYLRERAIDIVDVSKRLKFNLMGKQIKTMADITGESIIIANDLTPSQVIGLNRKIVKGIAIAHGGSTSHTAIIAKALGIPCVVGIPDLLDKVKHGEALLIDGDKGDIFFSPSPQEITEFKKYAKSAKSEMEELKEFINSGSVTEDGFKIGLLANISSKNDADMMLEFNGDGVGLFRTEFLYMTSNVSPSEDMQFAVYDGIAKSLGISR